MIQQNDDKEAVHFMKALVEQLKALRALILAKYMTNDGMAVLFDTSVYQALMEDDRVTTLIEIKIRVQDTVTRGSNVVVDTRGSNVVEFGIQ